jgi:hypothetical protein
MEVHAQRSGFDGTSEGLAFLAAREPSRISRAPQRVEDKCRDDGFRFVRS